jgi:hypothetical protein
MIKFPYTTETLLKKKKNNFQIDLKFMCIKLIICEF